MQSAHSVKRSPKWMPWVLGLAAIATLGTAGTLYLSHQTPAPQFDLAKDTVEVKSSDLVLEIKASGVVQAVRKINLSPKESGRLMQLMVKEGDRVSGNQLVARMDDQQVQAQVTQYRAGVAKAQADLLQKQQGERPEVIAEARARVGSQQAAVRSAQAKLNRASDELRRNQTIAQEGAIARNALEDFATREREARANLEAEQARLNEQQEALRRLENGNRPGDIAQSEADVAQATAQLRAYETQLENTIIRAPFAGIITRRYADVGDFVSPATSASTSDGATSSSIAELSSGLEVEAKVPEASIARIKPGQKVTVRSDSYPDVQFEGRVKLIAPRAIQENNVTTFRVKVELQTGLEQLKAGMNVRLAFLGEPIQNAIAVPLAAIVTQKDGQKGVWIADAGKARFQIVKIGSESTTQVQISEGLKIGDRVFLSPPPGAVIPGVDNTEGTGL